eukprot:COSAG04_NODE_1855_length_5385_cov_4.796443_3_plen_133_part_00
MSLLATAAKYGTKLVSSAMRGLKLGQKAVGAVQQYGDKAKSVASMAETLGVPGADKISKAVGVVSNVQEAAGKVGQMAKSAESGIRGAQSAMHAGNVHQALGIVRDTAKDEWAAGKDLKAQAKSTLERAKRK